MRLVRGNIIKKSFMSFAFKKITRITVHCKLVPVHYRFLGQEIFLGLKKYAYFLGLISTQTFRFEFSLQSVDQKNIHLNFFSVTCVREKLCILRRQYIMYLRGWKLLMPGIFWI